MQRWYQCQLTEVPAFLLLAATTPFSNKCGSCPRLNGFRDHSLQRLQRLLLRSSYVSSFREFSPPGQASAIMSFGSSVEPIIHLPITQLVQAPRRGGLCSAMTSTSAAATTWNQRIATFHQPCLGQLACLACSEPEFEAWSLCLSLYARRCLVVVPKPSSRCQSFFLVSRRSCPNPDFSLLRLCCRKETLTRNTTRCDESPTHSQVLALLTTPHLPRRSRSIVS